MVVGVVVGEDVKVWVGLEVKVTVGVGLGDGDVGGVWAQAEVAARTNKSSTQ